MSKLTEKLRKVGQSESSSIGFGFHSTRTKSLSLLVVAELSPEDTQAAQEALLAGADALLFRAGAAGDITQLLSVAGDVPVGVTLGDGESDLPTGIDFLLAASLTTPASVLHLDGPGKLLVLDAEWSDATLRAVEGLPVDGVLVRLSGPFTIETWLRCLRFGALARKTLLVALDNPEDRDALRSLRDAGVSAVVVPVGAIAGVKGLIESLPAPKRYRDRNRRDALVPSLPRAASQSEDEEEE